ncbi:hypothetical protein [Actinomadura sp. 9N215]|uniref:hypothetical protein n=1 Tax=Actinomadura sp. 9N215 TaxID=3375150 RepID=UPI0037BD4F96
MLLDTGPTLEESEQIRAIFDDMDMTAEVEGHSYGGPPPTSAFLVVVNSDLSSLLDAFLSQGTGEYSRFERWAVQMLALRSDERRWGKQHTLKLEDDRYDLGILLCNTLPTEAYRTILRVDLSGFDRGSPPTTIEWNEGLRAWRAHPHAAPRHIARRIRLRSDAKQDESRLRDVSEADLRTMWRLTEDPDLHTVTWQRAKMVLWSAVGWSPRAIADKLLVSELRTRETIHNFNADGFSSFEPGYSGGRPARLTPEEEQEAMVVAAGRPRDHGLPIESWDAETLSDFLVSQGVVEDITQDQVTALLDSPANATAPRTPTEEPQGPGGSKEGTLIQQDIL